MGLIEPKNELSSVSACRYEFVPPVYNNYFQFLIFSSPVLQALKDHVIKECVVGPRHVAFLLEVSLLTVFSHLTLPG